MTETDDCDKQDGDQSAERKHGGHRLVQLATERYNILLAIDSCDEWNASRLKSVLTEALTEINAIIAREVSS